MHFIAKFSVLLMTVIAVLFTEGVAIPTKRQTRMMTIPIRPFNSQIPRDIHPQLYMQQLINRSERRFARFTGRALPSDDELRAVLYKRMDMIESASIVPGSPPGGHRQEKSPEFVVNDAAANCTVADGSAGNHPSANDGVSPVVIKATEAGGLTNASQPTAAHSIGLDIQGADIGYVGLVQIGTPPKVFKLLMDSGSADLWVGSETCQSLEGKGCGHHSFLGPTCSSTFVDTHRPFNVSYSTGTVAGTIISDTVLIAGFMLRNLTFGAANVESDDFTSDETLDGLLGLAQSGLSAQQTPTVVELLRARDLISASVTSYKLSRLADQKNDGEITFGGLDETKFDKTTLVSFPNINVAGFWEGEMDAIAVNGNNTVLAGGRRSAVLDTGTTLIIAPHRDVLAIHHQIDGAHCGVEGCTMPCTTNASVSLTFNGATFPIDPRDIARIPMDLNNPTGRCHSGIVSGEFGTKTQWLVGDVFLKNVYFSTDVGKDAISLAKLV